MVPIPNKKRITTNSEKEKRIGDLGFGGGDLPD